MARDHEHYMRLALDEARKAGAAGNRAVGAVIVREDVVVGRGGNCRDSATDPTGHAETAALRDAAARAGSMDFSACTLYTTLEPCPMCCGAIIINNLPTVVIGAMHSGEAIGRMGDYTVHKLVAMMGKGNRIVTGVLTDECDAVLQEWEAKHGRA